MERKPKNQKLVSKWKQKNSYTDTTRKNLLENNFRKQYLAAEQLLDSQQLPDKRPKSTSICFRNEEMCKTWNTKYNNIISSKTTVKTAQLS